MLNCSWWERLPERLEAELEALRRAGITFERDEPSFAEGRLVLHLEVTLPSLGAVKLIARYPALYPYERVLVDAPDLDLAHHQHPFGKNLCLIGRDTRAWRVSDTLASFITDRLLLVIAAGSATDPQVAADIEEHQSEPFSEYYDYQRNAIMLIDGAWRIDAGTDRGSLLVGLVDLDDRAPLRGAILEIRDQKDRLLAKADPAIAAGFPRRLVGRWLRAPGPVRQGNPSAFLDELIKLDPRLRERRAQAFGRRTAEVIAVLFPEERQWRDGASHDGWVFLGLTKPTGAGHKSSWMANFIRAGRSGRGDLAERVPELNGVQERKVAVFGLGGVGAPSAIHLARAGVGALDMLDADYFDPATGRRWSLGLPYAGLDKTAALVHFISLHHPFTKVRGFDLRLGDPNAGPHELKTLNDMLDGADLIYDATAERGLQHLLADLARERGKPYVCLSSVKGAWGGLVALILPDGPCWMCLQYTLADGSIPPPPENPDGDVQPAGCADPTFTGSGFDLEQIALTAVRLAIGTLANGRPGAYPEAIWNVGVLSLRDESGAHIPPTWQVFQLETHPDCPRCSAQPQA